MTNEYKVGLDLDINVDRVEVTKNTTEDKVDKPHVHFSSDNNMVMLSDDKKGSQNNQTDFLHKSNGPFQTANTSRQSSKEEMHTVNQERLLLAATLVQDARHGRSFSFKPHAVYVRSYNLYHKFYLQLALYFFIGVNLALALIEKPAKPGWEIPYWGTMIIELACLSFFTFRLLHTAHFSKKVVFWRDTKNLLVLITILLTFLDMICYIIWINVLPDSNPIRWSRPLRPLFIVNFSDGRQIRRAFRNIRRTVPEILNILILFILSVLLFGLLALKLFNKRLDMVYANGEPYFKNYFDSIWDLYVLVTTANNPDVMMPAYDKSSWYALFFIIYLIICLYIFMSIVLAAIYNTYRKNLKNEIRIAVYGKRRKLAQAFEIMKTYKHGDFVISYSAWCQLMRVVTPNRSPAQLDLLMRILDSDGTNTIKKKQFLMLTDLLELKLTEVQDRLTLLAKLIPKIYNSKASIFLKCGVRHKGFRIFFDLMIFANAWFIGFDVDESDWFFLGIFTVEILLKLYVYGPREFYVRFWNIFDFFVIFGAMIATIVEAAEHASKEELRTLDVLLVLRVLRLIKLFGSIKWFKVVLQTIINIGPSIATYGGVIFVFYYLFAIIGMEIFHGLVTFHGYNVTNSSQLFCGNKALNGTTFYFNQYCSNNFNDILAALVVLFELTVVNQWHVISSGFVYVTNKAARLYFFAFHMCCVVIVLNIFVAFVLEAFILEYTLQTAGRLETVVEAKIKELGLAVGQAVKSKEKSDNLELVYNEELPHKDPVPITGHKHSIGDESEDDDDVIPDFSKEKGLKFHLKKKSRKKVEVLLQQMFEGEIDPEDEGPEAFDQDFKPPRKLTLDLVT